MSGNPINGIPFELVFLNIPILRLKKIHISSSSVSCRVFENIEPGIGEIQRVRLEPRFKGGVFN